MLHGRLPAEVKDDVMRRLAAGDVDVLVATTVIEVGVDVANATAMIVLDADRFGISQLHQLRGRVGRGTHPGVCLLVTAAEPGTIARERLDGVADTLDGFELARLDLEQRREGDVLGETQSGRRSQAQACFGCCATRRSSRSPRRTPGRSSMQTRCWRRTRRCEPRHRPWRPASGADYLDKT